MQRKRGSEELVLEATRELLAHEDIGRITVRMICEECGITRRTFYNHFLDKNEVVSRIYIDHMRDYVGAGLVEWTERRSDLFMQSPSFGKHTFSYRGQNSIVETITEMERQKFELHIDPGVEPDSLLMKEIRQGIIYMINGQLGLLLATFRGEIFITERDYEENYANTWDLMSRWAPAVVIDNLQLEPVVAGAYWDDAEGRICVPPAG